MRQGDAGPKIHFSDFFGVEPGVDLFSLSKVTVGESAGQSGGNQKVGLARENRDPSEHLEAHHANDHRSLSGR